MEKLRDFVPSPAMLRTLTTRAALWKLTPILILLALALNLTQRLLSVTKDPAIPGARLPILLPSDRALRLAVFSDLHFGGEPDDDAATLRLMREVLASETPHLVVLNGDLVTGKGTRGNVSAQVDELVQPMLEVGVPWASTYGTSDSLSFRESVFAAESRHALCHTSRADEALPGLTNYVLPIGLPSPGARPKALLWFFDSGAGEGDGVPPQTASWFLNNHAILARKNGRILPSLAFVRSPPTAYLPQTDGGDPARSTFADALRSAEGLHSLYAGRPGGDDACAPAGVQRGEAPFLCLGRQSGYPGDKEAPRGARIVELRFYGYGEGWWGVGAGMEVETWVRLEGGEVVGKEGLSESYKGEWYPDAKR